MSSTIYTVMQRGDESNWIIKAFSNKEAAEEHIVQLKDNQTKFKAVADLVTAFRAHYYTQNKQPQYPSHLRLPKVKFPGRAEEITQAMRDERAHAIEHNKQIDNEHAQKMGEYSVQLNDALATFLKSLNVQQDWQDKFLTGHYFESEMYGEFYICETELD